MEGIHSEASEGTQQRKSLFSFFFFVRLLFWWVASEENLNEKALAATEPFTLGASRERRERENKATSGERNYRRLEAMAEISL